MFTTKVGHGQWPGSDAASVLQPGACEGSQRAADEYCGEFPPVVGHAESMHTPHGSLREAEGAESTPWRIPAPVSWRNPKTSSTWLRW